MLWEDARLAYWERLVAVRERRYVRLLLADAPGWVEALGLYHLAGDGLLLYLQGVGR